MSGKKRGEVAFVLKNADETRKDIINRYSRNIDDLINKLENNLFDASFFASDNKDSNFDKKEIETLIGNVKISKISVNDEKKMVAECKDRIKSIDKEVRELEKIFKNRTDNHYFDSEYNRAQTLLNRYTCEFDEMHKINSSLQDKINKRNYEIKRNIIEEKMADAVTEFDGTLSIIESMKFSDPRKKDRILNLNETCTEVLGNKEIPEKISKLKNDYKVNLNNSDFNGAKLKALELKNYLYQIQSVVDDEMIRILELRQTASTIVGLLRENQDSDNTIQLNFINGLISNGFIIKSDYPQPVEFQILQKEVKSDDGTMTKQVDIKFEIDKNDDTCSKKAEEFQKKLNESGIPLNIVDWGSRWDPDKPIVLNNPEGGNTNNPLLQGL